MSNIPNSAMPHAGGNSASAEDSRQATQTTGSRADSPAMNFDSQNNSRGQQSNTHHAQTGEISHQPDHYRETNYAPQRSGSLMDRARDHKGLAVGIAVGAIAAAALPMMFAGKKKSSDRQKVDYSADVYVDNRDRHARGRNEGVVTADTRTVGSTGTGAAAGTGDLTMASGRKKSTNDA